MSDLQVRDVVETNEYATEDPRLDLLVDGTVPEGKSRYFTAGERGVIKAIEYDRGEPFLIYVRFDDGSEDNLYAGSLDLVYRPINDPALYDRSLLDLVEEQS